MANPPQADPLLVTPDDPRYFDLRFFAAQRPSETWVHARLAQVAAVEARKRGTITISDKSASGRGWEDRLDVKRALSDAGSLRQAFPALIPARPYCADTLEDGLQIRKKAEALKKRHLQLNGRASFQWMPHDIDRSDAAQAHANARLPPPNVIAINPDNGHAHSAVLLANPVARHAASRVEPLRFFAAVERGIARRLGADRLYTGLIAKNPVHEHWLVEWRREEPYSLPELAEFLTPEEMTPDISHSETMGVGRNCTVFDDLRHIAYREVREFKQVGRSMDEFAARLERVALGINLQFPEALKLSEIRAIVKSVTRWTWLRFSSESFSARQSFLGQRGMAKRWENHMAESTTKPWETMAISRRTYYRRKAEAGSLVEIISENPDGQ